MLQFLFLGGEGLVYGDVSSSVGLREFLYEVISKLVLSCIVGLGHVFGFIYSFSGIQGHVLGNIGSNVSDGGSILLDNALLSWSGILFMMFLMMLFLMVFIMFFMMLLLLSYFFLS